MPTQKQRVKRPVGRPRKVPPSEAQQRVRTLWRVRNRAVSLLIQRHPEEFEQIKADLLEKAGLPPIESKHARSLPKVTLETGLEDL